jgi:hypothetical protein
MRAARRRRGRVQTRLCPPDGYRWSSGIDAATGQRVRVAIKTPERLLAEIRGQKAAP